MSPPLFLENKRDKIRALLKKLRKRQKALEEKLKKESDAKTRKRTKTELKGLRAQRKKRHPLVPGMQQIK